ncbi:hypothetical protein [Nocardia testacea]|uniref:hypothetical protein n=1 Tax=Nocardia testacea TaxID=248551 RepID=UPI003A86C621
MFRQLDVTITRTDVTRRPSADGVRGGGDESPLIINDRASERRRALLRALRLAAAQPPYAPRALSPHDAALAILTNLSWTSRVLGAEEWMRELCEAITRAWGCVDAAPEVEFAGLCENCGRSVAGPGYLRVLKCRHCGEDHRAELYKGWMREAVEECTGTAAELAQMLPHFEGAPVKAATIRKWHERGKLIGCVTERGTTFRIGDVLALHRRQRTRLLPLLSPA